MKFLSAILDWFMSYLGRTTSRAQAAEKHVEAIRQRAKIDEEVGKLADGAAEAALKERWNRAGPHVVLLLLLAGCAPSAPVAVDTGCDWTRYILVGDADRLTDLTARAILAHNETRAVRCK